MLTLSAAIVYAAAMTLANLSVAAFGPSVIPLNAFVLIGLDLALRNLLALRLSALKMLALIGASAAISYALNPASGQIAAASFAAFTASALADWLTFSTLGGKWLRRCIGGVAVGAAVDSLVFPLAAGFSLAYAPGMFAAKVAGGWLWALMLKKLASEEKPA